MRGGFFLLASLAAASAWADQALEYGWKRGQIYVYRLDIVARTTDYISSARGHAVYSVRAANEHGFTIRNHDLTSIQRHTGRGRMFPPFGIFKIGWRHFDGGSVGRKLRPHFDAVISRQGQWLISNGGPAPVSDLANPGSMIIETLPAEAVDTWAVESDVQVIHETREKIEGGGRLVKIKKTPLRGSQKITYTVTGTKGELVSIRKDYTLTTKPGEGNATIAASGQGTLVFDKKLGIFRSLQFDAEVKQTTAGEIKVMPMKISYTLLEGRDRTQALKPPTPAGNKERRPLTTEQRTEALRDLQRRVSFPRHRAADLLARAEPGKGRAEIAAALVPVLTDTDPFTRQAACRALAVWGDSSSIPALVARLNDHSMTVRWAALDALGLLPDARAARPIARHLSRRLEVAPAIIALARLGTAAEPALIGLLSDPNAANRQVALQLLAQQGTQRSALPLMARLSSKDSVTANLAKEALASIMKRQGRGPLRGEK